MNDCGGKTQERQVAIAHYEMLADVVSMEVNFWELKERKITDRKMLATRNIVDAAGRHIALRTSNQTSSTLSKTFAHDSLRWACARKCLRVDPHRAQVSRDIFDGPEGRGIFVDKTPAEAL